MRELRPPFVRRSKGPNATDTLAQRFHITYAVSKPNMFVVIIEAVIPLSRIYMNATFASNRAINVLKKLLLLCDTPLLQKFNPDIMTSTGTKSVQPQAPAETRGYHMFPCVNLTNLPPNTCPKQVPHGYGLVSIQYCLVLFAIVLTTLDNGKRHTLREVPSL